MKGKDERTTGKGLVLLQVADASQVKQEQDDIVERLQ